MPNITQDVQIQLGDGHAFFEDHPNAAKHLQHHTLMDRRRAGRKIALADDVRDKREALDDSKRREGFAEQDVRVHGEPVKTDPNGKKTAVDWRAPFRREQARFKALIVAAEHEAKKLGASVAPDLDRFISSARPDRYIEIDLPPIADERSPLAIIGEREKNLREIERLEEATQNMNRDNATVEALIRADWKRRRKEGKPNFSGVLMGGSFRYNGQFTPRNPTARINFPSTGARVHAQTADVFVEVDDTLNFLAWLDDDEIFLNKIIAAAKAANEGQQTLSEADKVKALAEIAVRKLEAQRALEAAYVHAERQGIEFKRRPLPPEVLLWLQPANGSANLSIADDATDNDEAPVEEPDFEPDFEAAED